MESALVINRFWQFLSLHQRWLEKLFAVLESFSQRSKTWTWDRTSAPEDRQRSVSCSGWETGLNGSTLVIVWGRQLLTFRQCRWGKLFANLESFPRDQNLDMRQIFGSKRSAMVGSLFKTRNKSHWSQPWCLVRLITPDYLRFFDLLWFFGVGTC